MVERRNKPSALTATPGMPPQPTVTFTHDNSRVVAELPSGERVEVLMYGATVISWKDAAGAEKLWLSDAAKLDGSKPVRGGIPIVFPVFGTAPAHAQAGRLPQHGFARTSRWEFLGKSTSESTPGIIRIQSLQLSSAAKSPSSKTAGGKKNNNKKGDEEEAIKLDFGLSANNLSDEARTLWPFDFSAIYSVTLARGSLETTLVVTNDGDKPFDCQMLLHTYLRVKDIATTKITGLDGVRFVDRVGGAGAKLITKTQAGPVTITGETDRIYMPASLVEESPEATASAATSLSPSSRPNVVDVVEEGGSSGAKKVFSLALDNLGDVVMWNPWEAKAATMSDFAPADGFRRMICIEAGAVRGWQALDPGDSFEGSQTITAA